MAGLVTTLRRPRVTADRGRLRRLLSAQYLVIFLAVAIIAYLGAVPIAFMLWKTFVIGGHLSFANFRSAYTSVGIGTMMLNTLVFAFGSSAVALAIGSVLAYLIARTDVPGKPLMFAASLVPLIIPGILHTIAWVFILSLMGLVTNVWQLLALRILLGIFSGFNSFEQK